LISRPLFSVLHPTARPAAWRLAYDQWISRALNSAAVEYILCVDERWGFRERVDILASWMMERVGSNFVVWNHGRKCWVDAVNDAARPATGSVLVVASDDIEPPTAWDALLLKSVNYTLTPISVRQRDYVIHVSTGYCDGPQACGIQIMSRERYLRLGHVLYPEYESLYADDDFLQHAYQDEAVIEARMLMFRHRHAAVDDWDAVYHHQNRSEARVLGAALLQRRVACHFSEGVAEHV